MKPIIQKPLYIIIAVIMLCSSGYTAPLKALIIDGQNNHDWKATTPVLKEILEDSGRFTVDVATSPPKGESMSGFRPPFSNYDVVISNYTGDLWPKQTQADFEAYVKNGGGFVSFHAANNAFPKWLEFNKIIALGGWGGRNEKSGPMVRIRDGEMVLDHSPGRGGAHGPRWNYPIVMHDLKHPISKGLPRVWKHAKDELYAKLRGPANIKDLLGYAESKLTSENEPLLFTVEYGNGRVFHTALGHDVYAMRCVGFAFTLQRGAEWAATGKVTLRKVPENFPTEDEVRFWLEKVDLNQIIAYEYGQSREALATVESNIRIATDNQLRKIEDQMLAVLNSDDATFYARSFACRILRRIGTSRSVNTLGAFLSDDQMSHPARLALQGIQSNKVDSLFRKSLRSLTGGNLVGLIGSIAERQDQKAVRPLAKLLSSEDEYIQQVIIRSLGRIGGKTALQILDDLSVNSSLEPYRLDALLLCADSLIGTRSSSSSKDVYEALSSNEHPSHIRIAAYSGLIKLDPDASLPLVLSLLDEDDAKLRKAACGPFLRGLPGPDASKRLAGELTMLSNSSQIDVLNALAVRGHSNVVPEVLNRLRTEDPSIQIAALQSLGSVGDERAVSPLMEFAIQPGATGRAAQLSLARIKGDAANEAIVDYLDSQHAGKRIAAINAIVDRSLKDKTSRLFTMADDTDRAVRSAAYEALKSLGGSEDIPAVLRLLHSESNEQDLQSLLGVVQTLSVQLSDPAIAVNAIADLYSSSTPPVKTAFIHLLTGYSGDTALEIVTRSATSDEEPVQTAAFKALGQWKDNSPIEFLLGQLPQLNGEQRTLAYQAIIHSLSLTQPDSPLFNRVKEHTKSPSEKNLFIDTLAQVVDLNSLEHLESYLNDSAVKDRAISAYETLINKLSASQLDRSNWVLSASHNQGALKNAIDGNLNSRWDTGTPQTPGMWFQIDIGAQRSIQKIVLDSSRSSGDYPRGYEVLLSSDSNAWSEPVVSGKGETAVVEIEIPNRSARFIRINQTGSVDGLFWSIHELDIEATMDTELLNEARSRLETLR